MQIRTMQRSDLDIAVEWAAREGWNPGRDDARSFYAADPQGFFMGTHDGAPVATVSAVRYGDGYGFVGFFIVAPEFRGRGFGRAIFTHAMRHLDGRNAGLDGVLEQEQTYRRSGFSTRYRHVRYEGVGARGADDSGIVDLETLGLATVLAYDARMFAAARTAFVREWIRQPGGAALGFMRSGALVGYGVLRACRRGFKIGPLFADDAQVADALFRALAARAASQPIFLDIPNVNESAHALTQRYAMQPVFETVRMYTADAPEVPLGAIYGVTSLELG